MTSLREAIDRRIIARDTAEEIGRLRRIIIGSDTHVTAITTGDLPQVAMLATPAPSMAVAAMPVEPPPPPSIVIDWTDIVGFGPDAIVVPSAAALRAPASEHERYAAEGGQDLLDRPAMTDGGDALGTIKDVQFDEKSGHIEGVVVGDATVKVAAIVAVGPHGVIVTPA